MPAGDVTKRALLTVQTSAAGKREESAGTENGKSRSRLPANAHVVTYDLRNRLSCHPLESLTELCLTRVCRPSERMQRLARASYVVQETRVATKICSARCTEDGVETSPARQCKALADASVAAQNREKPAKALGGCTKREIQTPDRKTSPGRGVCEAASIAGANYYRQFAYEISAGYSNNICAHVTDERCIGSGTLMAYSRTSREWTALVRDAMMMVT